MNKRAKTIVGVVSGIAMAAAALFLSKKENREKTKKVVKQVATKVTAVAKRSAKTAARKVATAKKKTVTVANTVQKTAGKVQKALK